MRFEDYITGTITFKNKLLQAMHLMLLVPVISRRILGREMLSIKMTPSS